MKVLIIEDDPSIGYFLSEVVSSAGHEVEVVDDGGKAVERFEMLHPELIICDIMLPNRDGFQILEEIRSRDHDVVFIMMTGQGTEEFAMRALELRANNYLHKPIRFEMITALLEKYSDQIRSRTVRREIGLMVTRRETTLELGNRLDRVADVVEYLVNEASTWLSPDERFSVQLGLYELIINAIEHGNLAITYDEKSKALYGSPASLSDLIRKRQQDPRFGNRRVRVDFRFNGERLEWVVTDEGQGFNWYSLPNPLAMENQENLNGRGIFLARIQFDELTFLGCGNKVRAIKRYTATPQEITPLAIGPGNDPV